MVYQFLKEEEENVFVKRKILQILIEKSPT